jgi:hypothetical protein
MCLKWGLKNEQRTFLPKKLHQKMIEGDMVKCKITIQKPLITVLLALTFSQYFFNAYAKNVTATPSINVLLGSNVRMKPNSIHSYYLTASDYVTNITFPSANNLRISKGNDMFQIYCSSNDNVSIAISKWFYPYLFAPTVTFIATAEDETTLTFGLYSRSLGEPVTITGATYTYSSTTTLITLTATSGIQVTLSWTGQTEQVTVWFWANIDMFFGLGGCFAMILGATMTVKSFQDHDGKAALIWLFVIVPIGFALFVGWIM